MKRDILSILDLSREDILKIFELAEDLKSRRDDSLKGHTLALIFEKPSLRTRVTFEVAMNQLGGSVVYLSSQDIQMGKRESVKDIAKNLSKWVDLIAARVFSHRTLLELSRNAEIPVINALSDLEHPCQVLADYFTLREVTKPIIAWIGDGNNVCNSLILGAGLLDVNLRVATPRGYEPEREVIKKAQDMGGDIEIFNDPIEAVKGADVIYTDVWTSMGQEEEREKRRRDFKDFQVNEELLKFAKANCLVMHCLPAHRGEEITDEVIDGKNSIVWKQAENRLYIEKAIIKWLSIHPSTRDI